MKSIITTAILTLPSLLWGQAVNNYSFPDAKWNVAETFPSGNQQNPNFVATTTTVYGFQGDSTFNNELWNKLYSTNDPLFESNLLYLGLIREVNELVIFVDTLEELDTLYNFNLLVGDSAFFDLGPQPSWLKVLEVSTIQINGEIYKSLKFEEPIYTAFDRLNEVWIEGIGSIHGPLFPHSPRKFSEEIPDSMLLTCSHANSQIVYQQPYYEYCYTNVVLGLSDQDNFDLKIYPIPFSDKLTFESDNLEPFDLTIVNNLGITTGSLQIGFGKQIIDLTFLREGIYFLNMKVEGRIKTIKVIKKQ
jgi:hypothetical protein